MGVIRGRACLRLSHWANRGEPGQMTVEFVVAFPVMIIVAVIAVNALVFFGDCACFDRTVRDAVRIYAASPGYDQSIEQTQQLITEAVGESVQADNLSVSVAVAQQASDQSTYTATLLYAPTLFGLGLKSSVFGVSLPYLEHSVSMTVDTYKPGVIL